MNGFSFPANLKRWSRRLAIGLGVAGALLANALLSEQPAPPEQTGLSVGQRAPEFTLADQTGKPRSLSGLLREGPVALVFYRSADW